MQHKNQILLCFTLRKHLDIVATSFALKIHLVATPANYETITKNVKKKQNFCKILQKKTISKNLQQKSCIGFNKVASLNPAALIKKRLRHSCFPMNLSKFLKQWLLLKAKTKLARKCEILLNFVVSKFCKKFFDQRISKNLTVHYSVESIVVLIK